MGEEKESEIEKAICEYFAFQNLFFWKNPNIGVFDFKNGGYRRPNRFCRKGIPDLIIIHRGRFIGVEIKSRLGRQSSEQKIIEGLIRKSGGLYFIARSISDAENIYRAIMEL